ncbi:DUF975 family protein [Niallia sp. Sow4_A1]|jgi:uncharacterized membrane protein|uniref:DUF975 family protein n=1 Tax=Niallia hominis TaxID=3133173 RepID=A0ABV1F1N9_9BACI|nr:MULTISPECIES: DUF975 family protein [Bacillaceae]MCF2648310.1 DUF975 family protein [Niallia circulans]MCM3362172.1 DUF975 family protein [Niallia sp. MER TA 168]CAI9386852.1 hypothetical protein BACSP_01787 [Bacillus sp. T2.9-1]
MKIKQIKTEARQALRGYWGKGVFISFIYFFVSMVLTTIVDILFSGGIHNWLYQEYSPVGSEFGNFIISLLYIPLTVGIIWFYLGLVRTENPQVSQIFSIYTNVALSVKLIGTNIMIGIFTFLWSLLFLIPGIIKGLAYSQTMLLLKDNPEFGIFEAITESRRRMDGYKWKYFLLGLSFIGWGLLCILSIGIGFLWLVPYVYTANATFYENHIAEKEVIEL